MSKPENPQDLKEFYRMFTTPFLDEYATALELDKVAGADHAFCQGRLKLIDEVLAERGTSRKVAVEEKRKTRRRRPR